MKIAAIDIGGTAIKYCLYDDAFQFSVDMLKEVSSNAKLGAQKLMETVCGVIRGMGDFDAIAVSTAGQVNPIEGSIIYATQSIPGYTGMPVKKILSDCFNVPVFIENDVNAAALGEAFYGAGKGFKDFICLTYGTGIGGAIIINGNIYYGSAFSAGEFGHIVTHANGLACGCGKKGCYECYASTRALVRMAKEQTGFDMNGREIFEHIDNPLIKSVVISWLDEIMVGLASLIHIFNPPCIILGGGIMNEEFIINYINEHIKEHIINSYGNVKILKAQNGNAAGILGAICRAKQSMENL